MKHILLVLLFCCGSVVAGTPLERPAGIAENDDPLIVAGYRALFTCSAHFFAGRPLKDIKQVELVDTTQFGFPDPQIDEKRQLVTAASLDGHVMTAAFRPTMGCTLLPPQWHTGDLPGLPYVAYGDQPDVSEVPFPQGDRVSLRRDGLHRSYRSLRSLLDKAFDGESFGNGNVTVGVVIVAGDELIAERYRPGFGVHSGYRTWSTAKSITGALMGIAASKGVLDMDKPAPIPEWQMGADPRSAITLKHLMWMSSGLFSGGSNTAAIYFGGQDVLSAATTTHLEAKPGTRWKYANNDTLLLLRALRHQLKDDLTYLRFPYDELFHRIGMYHTRMETDHQGNFIGSSQTYTTARDLARFGILLAQDGVWNNERILPVGWTQFLATPAPTRPVAAGEQGYGAQFWLLDQLAGVPKGTYTSAGNKGQFVTVVPDRQLVIVRTGVNPNGVRWDQGGFVAEVVAALGTPDNP